MPKIKDLQKHVPLDELASNLAGLGAPGLVLLMAVGGTELTGASAVAAALVALGPGGMIGGAVTLVLIGLITRAVSEYGFELVYKSVMDDLFDQGETKESLLRKIERYPLSSGLRAKVRDYIEAMPTRPTVDIDVVVEKVERAEDESDAE